MMDVRYASDIRDIKPPIFFTTNLAILLILAIILLAIFLLLAGFFAYKRLKEKRRMKGLTPKLPHERAYEALDALKAKNLIKEGKVKEFYFELSNIIRRYIEDRFSVRAPEMTTEEFLSFLRNLDLFSGVHKNLLKEFLNLCDIVKFAKYGPTEKEIESNLSSAFRLVDETKDEPELEKASLK